MRGNNMSRGEKVFFFLAAGSILSVVFFGEKLAEWNLILPVVALVFILAFGFLGWQIIKDWKKPDEEILDTENVSFEKGLPWTQKRTATYEERRGFFLGSIGMVFFILFQEKQLNAGSLIFCGIVLTAGCVFYLPALIQKRRGKEGQPLFPKAKLQPEQIFYMLFSLFGVCFIGFWIYMVMSKTGLWWFCIPAVIIGAGIARPLVAGLRILLRKEKHPGEKHIRKKKEQDPWDRPDRKL